MEERIRELIAEGYTPEQAAEIAANEGGSNRVEDFNGWFEVKRNPISRVGVFPYLGSSLGEEMIKERSLDPNAIYMVLRPAEELGDPAFQESCKLIPWVDEHTMLGGETTGYTAAEDKGIGGVTGEQIEFDEDSGILYANIKLYSEAHRTQVESGKRELSLGYRCQYHWAPGSLNGENYDLIQRTLRGNHLASVKEGRMGPGIAVLDHNDIKGTSAMDELIEMMAAMLAKMKEIQAAQAGGDPVDVVAEVDSDDTKGTDEEPKVDEELKATDEEPEEVKAGDEDTKATDEEPAKPVTAEGMDAAIEKRVAEKFASIQRGAQLAQKLKPHVGVFDHSGKTELEIAQYGVKKLGITVSKGQELGALAGFLKAAKDPSQAVTVKHGTGMDSATKGQTLLDKKLAAQRGAK